MGTEFETGFGEGETGEIAARHAVESARANMATDSIDFAVVFCSPIYDCESVVAGVRSVTPDAKIVGATAQGKFTERGVHTSAMREDTGVTVALMSSDELRFFTGMGTNVSEDIDGAVAEAAGQLPDSVDGYPYLTGLFLSSVPVGREELAHHTYQAMPIQWVGGGANDLTFENVTVFVDDVSASDAIALTLIASKRPMALGVGNRHEPIGGSVEVTSSEGSVVHELDGKPAYDVWKSVFEATARDRYGFSMDEMEADRQLRYQAFTELVFGLKTGEDTYKIRSPFLTQFYEPYRDQVSSGGEDQAEDPFEDVPTPGSIPEGSLIFSEPISEGMVLYPMTSGKEGTIQRGTKSVQHAMETVPEERFSGGLVFECPCGEATLQEDYHKLIEAVADPVDAPIAGIQSGGGEVCFRHDDMRGVNHTSTTLLLFPGGETA